MHISSTQTFVNASNELDQICKWLKSIGVNFSATRVGKYKKLFDQLARAQQDGNLDAYAKKYVPMEFLNAIVEKAQLARIYDGLWGLDDQKLVERLKKASRGHALFVMDNDDRSGRDFSLELDVAAKFVRNGYEIDFGHDADVKASKDGRSVFVECKRLKSENMIRENIKKGLKQLKNRYKTADDPDAARGMLVLSIGKIVNPGFGFLVGRDDLDIGKQCGRHADAFRSKYSRYWQYEGVDQRSLGVAMLLDTPGRTTDRDLPFSLHEIAISNIVHSSSPDHTQFIEVGQAFAPRQ
jgi:hypothetical protein